MQVKGMEAFSDGVIAILIAAAVPIFGLVPRPLAVLSVWKPFNFPFPDKITSVKQSGDI